MTWWTDISKYVRGPDDLRLLAEILRIHCGSVIEQQIYPVVTANSRDVRDPYTMDHNRRPAMVAVLMMMLEPGVIIKEHSESQQMAIEIGDRKETMEHLRIAASPLVANLEMVLLVWHRCVKRNNRASFDPRVKNAIRLFAETLTRAAQIYRETLERHRFLWDPLEPGYSRDFAVAGFNFAFGIDYVAMAITELSDQREVRSMSRTRTGVRKSIGASFARRIDQDDDSDVPGLVYDV
jgi:hypothetical protein